MQRQRLDCPHNWKQNSDDHRWHCWHCGQPFAAPSLPRQVRVKNMMFTLSGDVRRGDLVRWPSGHVDIVAKG